ncbi:MAG: ABC transporter permease [Lachnospiraceae bacterium]|nr:ABC transporter permease [Lachnospiraceae bacterium]
MQHFLYRIKMTLREKTGIFWAMVFPVFLGMLFYFMFGNIGNMEQFSNVKAGVIKDEDDIHKDMFLTLLKEAETEEGMKMFDVREYETEEEAAKALEEEEIEGYILMGDRMHLTVTESNTRTTLLKTFLDQYEQNAALITETAINDPAKTPGVVESLFAGDSVSIKEIPLKGEDKDPYTQYFYALISMTCLIASMIGMGNGIGIQADLSSLGARRNVAPTKKMVQVLTDFFASLFLYCIMVSIVLAIVIFVYKQDFGSNAGMILLGAWAGSFTGLAGGMLIGVVPNGGRAAKEGLCVAFFMVSSFLSGLQWVNITYYIEKYCPVINRINPATLVVNAFKSLAVFGDTKQYMVNLATLLGIGILFLFISIMKLRRTKYASI